MIHRIKIRNLSADAHEHTSTKTRIIVYTGLAILLAFVLIGVIFF